MKANTKDRLRELMNERELRQVDVLNMCKPICDKYEIKPVSKSQLSEWLKGSYSPNQWYLTVLGEAFGVNEVWLMGLDVPKKKDTSTSASDAEADFAMIELFSQLTEENKATAISVIKGLIATQLNR